LPTIDLAATEVESKPVAPAEAAAEPTRAATEAFAGQQSPPGTAGQTAVPEDGASQASLRMDDTPEPAEGVRPQASTSASHDGKSPLSGLRSKWAENSLWRLVGAGVAGGLAVMLGFLLAGPRAPANDSARVFDMRLVRVEQQIREFADRPMTTMADPKAFDDLTARIAKLETTLAAIRPSATDAALANRVAVIEGEVKATAQAVSLLGRRNDDIAAMIGEAHRRADAGAVAIAELEKKVALLSSAPVVRGEFDALAGRLAAVERSEKAVEAELAKRPADASPDRPGRLALAAIALKGAVERGEPFPAELASAKALAPDNKALVPLEPFAATGLPTNVMLGRELSVLAPSLYQAAGVAAREGGGFLERLQANAEKLVRVRPVAEVAGDDPAAIIARIEVKAAHNDVAGALGELAKLPAAARAPAEAWIKQAEARASAADASRRFAAETLSALGK
jgi:hypothetical protein